MERYYQLLLSLLGHPLFNFSVMVVTLAISFRQRSSVTAANILLVLGWFFGSVGIVRTGLQFRSSAALCMFLGGFLFLLSNWLGSPPIAVQPEDKFTLRNGRWVHTQQVVVNNIGSDALFSVWIKVSTESPGVAAEQLIIDGEVDPDAPSVRVQGVEMSSDAFGFFGSDKNGNQAIILRLYELPPGKQRVFNVSTTADADTVALAKGIGFKRAPDPMVRSAGEAGFDLVPPEDFKAKGPWWLVKKSSPKE